MADPSSRRDIGHRPENHLLPTGEHADLRLVTRDAAPVIAAQALLAHGVDGDVIRSYVQQSWRLDDVDALSAIAAARVLARRASPSSLDFNPDR